MIKTVKKTNKRALLLASSLLVFFLIGAGFAISAETGRVEFNGRTIILNDDNTWQFSDDTRQFTPEKKQQAADAPDCIRIKSEVLPVSVCLDKNKWQIGEKSDAAEFSFNTKDDKLYLLMITEKDEIDLGAFEKAIVSNAQKAAGLNPVEVVVKERIKALSLNWGRMVYIANIDGLKIEYENFFTTIKGKGSVQYVFYATTDDYRALASEIEKVTTQIAVE